MASIWTNKGKDKDRIIEINKQEKREEGKRGRGEEEKREKGEEGKWGEMEEDLRKSIKTIKEYVANERPRSHIDG